MSAPRGARSSLAVKIAVLAALVQAFLVTAIVFILHYDVGEPSRSALLGIALLMTVPVLVTYGVTRFVVGRLTVPVIDAYRRLAAGDFTADLPTITAGRDFLALRTGFRVMTEALERSLAEIRAADVARRRLFADLAHELATPTTTLLGISAAFRAGEGDREALLDHLEGESARLERLVADVRELALLEDPALALERAPCDVGALAESVVSRVRLAHGAAGDVTVDAPVMPLVVEVDPIRTEQILTNLLGNALRHAGAVPVVVRVRPQEGGVTIVVEDGGPGVPDDLLPELGRRLLRLDTTRERARGGHGLGLSIVRAIAARHEGNVTFSRASLGGLAVSVHLARPGRGAQRPVTT